MAKSKKARKIAQLKSMLRGYVNYDVDEVDYTKIIDNGGYCDIDLRIRPVTKNFPEGSTAKIPGSDDAEAYWLVVPADVYWDTLRKLCTKQNLGKEGDYVSLYYNGDYVDPEDPDAGRDYYVQLDKITEKNLDRLIADVKYTKKRSAASPREMYKIHRATEKFCLQHGPDKLLELLGEDDDGAE